MASALRKKLGLTPASDFEDIDVARSIARSEFGKKHIDAKTYKKYLAFLTDEEERVVDRQEAKATATVNKKKKAEKKVVAATKRTAAYHKENTNPLSSITVEFDAKDENPPGLDKNFKWKKFIVDKMSQGKNKTEEEHIQFITRYVERAANVVKFAGKAYMAGLLAKGKSYKISLAIKATFTRTFIGNEDFPTTIDYIPAFFTWKAFTVVNIQDYENFTKTFSNEILNKIDEYEKRGSDLVFYKVEYFDLGSAVFKAKRGGTFQELPDWIKNKKACVNTRNDEEGCGKKMYLELK